MLDSLYVDAPSLGYRAFFALPISMTDAEGRPVNAVRGFIDMVARLVAQRTPASVIAAFDADWRPAWRVDAYPGYKAERSDDPPELARQFEVLAEVLDAAGLARAEAANYEADDVLAALVDAKPGEERVAVVSGDRDLVALVRDPDVTMLYPARGIGRAEELDAAAVRERFGVPPDLYPDLALLRGDPSDGLPGVPGIGQVRAARLLTEFGSIDGILANLDRLPRRQAEAFAAARDYVAAARRVVVLRRDIEVDLTRPGAPDEKRMHALGEMHNLGGAPGRLLRALAEAAEARA